MQYMNNWLIYDTLYYRLNLREPIDTRETSHTLSPTPSIAGTHLPAGSTQLGECVLLRLLGREMLSGRYTN